MFIADGGGTQAFTLSAGKLQPAWKANNPGTSPVLAGGLLYVSALGGGLRVYSPTTGQQITRLVFGASHWNSPIVVDGKIAVPEGNANDHATTGTLNIFRLP